MLLPLMYLSVPTAAIVAFVIGAIIFLVLVRSIPDPEEQERKRLELEFYRRESERHRQSQEG